MLYSMNQGVNARVTFPGREDPAPSGNLFALAEQYVYRKRYGLYTPVFTIGVAFSDIFCYNSSLSSFV